MPSYFLWEKVLMSDFEHLLFSKNGNEGKYLVGQK